MLRYNGTSVPRDYEAQVQLAIWTFRHQLVFDPCITAPGTPEPSAGRRPCYGRRSAAVGYPAGP